jgi:hypothetical protein
MENELTPLEQLRKLNAELAEANRINAALLKGPLHTIANLVRAAKIPVNGAYDAKGKYRRGRAIRNIIERGF